MLRISLRYFTSDTQQYCTSVYMMVRFLSMRFCYCWTNRIESSCALHLDVVLSVKQLFLITYASCSSFVNCTKAVSVNFCSWYAWWVQGPSTQFENFCSETTINSFINNLRKNGIVLEIWSAWCPFFPFFQDDGRDLLITSRLILISEFEFLPRRSLQFWLKINNTLRICCTEVSDNFFSE